MRYNWRSLVRVISVISIVLCIGVELEGLDDGRCVGAATPTHTPTSSLQPPLSLLIVRLIQLLIVSPLYLILYFILDAIACLKSPKSPVIISVSLWGVIFFGICYVRCGSRWSVVVRRRSFQRVLVNTRLT